MTEQLLGGVQYTVVSDEVKTSTFEISHFGEDCIRFHVEVQFEIFEVKLKVVASQWLCSENFREKVSFFERRIPNPKKIMIFPGIFSGCRLYVGT